MASKKTPLISQPALGDTAEYSALFELIQSHGVPMLFSLHKYRQAADDMLVRLIADKRAQGKSWDDIGLQIGMTRQGAQQFVKRATAKR